MSPAELDAAAEVASAEAAAAEEAGAELESVWPCCSFTLSKSKSCTRNMKPDESEVGALFGSTLFLSLS